MQMYFSAALRLFLYNIIPIGKVLAPIKLCALLYFCGEISEVLIFGCQMKKVAFI